MFKGLDELKKKAEQTAKEAGDSIKETGDELAGTAEAIGEQAQAQATQASGVAAESTGQLTSAAIEGADQLTSAATDSAGQISSAASEAAESASVQAAATADAAATQAADIAADTTDRARRAQGKLKARWSEPETRVEKKFMKELIFFICTDCRDELGPLELGKWKKFLKDAIIGGAGVLTGNPILLVKGVAGAAGTATKGDKEPGMMAKLKGDSQRMGQAKEYLVQCEYCSKWYCSGCWVSEKCICKECSAKAEAGLELPKLGGMGSVGSIGSGDGSSQ